MKRSVILVVAIGVLTAVLIGYRFIKGKPAPQKSIEDLQKEEGVPVETVTTAPERFELWRTFSGEVQGKNQAVLYANMPARVAKIAARQGDAVRRGRTILRMDPLSATQSYAALQAARIQSDDAKRLLDRLTPLFEAGAVSREEYDQAKSRYEMSRAQLTDVGGMVTLSSPIDGTLTDLKVSEGDRVDPQQTLAVVADLSGARFIMDVSQADVEDLASGQTAVLCETGVARDDCPNRGSVSHVGMSADQQTRLFRVEVALGGEATLRPGTLRYAQVLTFVADGVIAVPVESIQSAGEKRSVFVIDDGVARAREVSVGRFNETKVVVLSGLSEGESVVTWGANRISDGVKVRIVGARGAAADETPN